MALTTKQKKFISNIGFKATTDSCRSGILASITTAQAILESAYGTSTLATKANNLFGIKDNDAWDGKTYTVVSKEEVNGKLVNKKSKFRKYNSWADSIADHSDYLCTRSFDNGKTFLYEDVIEETDYKKAAKALQKAGYSTYSSYASQLIDLIERYDLDKYDFKTPSVVKKSSSIESIMWLQRKLNYCYTGKLKKLTVDGVWGTKTQDMLEAYWKQLGWNIGSYAGSKTCKALSQNRKK